MRGLTFLFTLIVLLIAGTAAQAEWRGFSTADVNLRDGPSTRYGVVDVVPEGVRVFVDYCRRGWCAVDYRGQEGWMSRDYLARERVRNSRHLKENDALEYDGRDYREPYYDDESYREVIIVDPPRYRRRLRDGRRVRPERRARRANRNRSRVRNNPARIPRAERRNRRQNQAAAPRRQRPARVERRRNRGENAQAGNRRAQNRRIERVPTGNNNGCPTNIYCGGGIGPDPSNRK